MYIKKVKTVLKKKIPKKNPNKIIPNQPSKSLHNAIILLNQSKQHHKSMSIQLPPEYHKEWMIHTTLKMNPTQTST